MLLHWGTLEPQGGSKLASVRFSGPVRIRAICIHPHGASLFAQNPEVVSETEPDAFSLSVFLTAQSAPTLQDLKPKGTNVLVPTRLSYSGGLREFPLDMGPDYVTRLMVVQGDFMRVTLAVYGDVISTPVATPAPYEPIPLPDLTRHRLPPILDLSNTADPSLLARELLALNSDAPSLSIVIRSLCFLRDEHWDSAMYSNMEEDNVKAEMSGLDWLAKAMDTLVVPVSQDVDTAALKKCLDKALEVTSVKTNDILYMMAGILRRASAQPSSVINTILDTLDVSDILEINLLDKDILDRLQAAAANPLISRALRTMPVLDILQSFRDADSTSRSVKDAAINLLQRIHGWERFEKALSTPTPDIAVVTRWIKEIVSDDMTFGIFIFSMTEDESLASKLSGHNSQGQTTLPITLWNSTALTSLPEFLTFTRAFIGISCVMAVLSWSVHVSDAHCTERIFAMIRLWQEVDGYREIVNHLLLIPRLIYCLESLLKSNASNSPSTTLIHIEQVLLCLLTHADTMARPELVVLVNALGDPPASISEDERLEMVEISAIADGGLPEAVGTVLNWTNRPVDTSVARALQTALSVLEIALEDRETGEWKVMQAAWQEGSHGLVYCLVERFHDFVASIRSQFSLAPPPPLHPTALLRCLASSNAILRILSRLLPAYQLPSRLKRNLTRDVASLFIATDAVDSRYSQGSAMCQAARMTRPTCADAIAVLSATIDEQEADRVGGQLVLQTLLRSALQPEGDDPVTRLEQVFWLLDLVLPLSSSDTSGDRTEQRFWTRKVIPSVLPDLRQFMRALDVDHQIQLVKRLADLDRGEVALGQWFVNEELKYLISIMESLKKSRLDSDRHLILQAQLSNSFQFLTGLVETTSSTYSLEFFQDTQTLEDTAHILASVLDSGKVISSVLDFSLLLASHTPSMKPQLQLELIVTLLRGGGARPSALLRAVTILHQIQQAQVQAAEIIRVAGELGPSLQRATEDDVWQSCWRQDEEGVAQAIVSSLSWLVDQSKGEKLILPGISEASFTQLLERVTATLPESGKMAAEFRNGFIFSNDVDMRAVAEDSEPGTLTLSMNRLGELLTMPPAVPSTPRLSGESIFKMATLSPITALVGTSQISTLTKTYQNNDFRQLSVRQNTSRRPSMHVDVGV